MEFMARAKSLWRCGSLMSLVLLAILATGLVPSATLAEAAEGKKWPESTSGTPNVDSGGVPAFSLSSKFPIVLSGFLKTDALWLTDKTNGTDAPRFAASQPNSSDAAFSLTVQHSRVAIDWTDTDIGGARLAARVETDLFTLMNNSTAKFNNSQLRIRQLYVDLKFEKTQVRLGQSWDLFSPLNVATLNTNGNLWFGGNAGFRRPQVRVTHKVGMGDSSLKIAGSINSNVGLVGEDSAYPVFEGQLEFAVPEVLGGTMKVGVSGLWGEEEDDSIGKDATQWGIAAHVIVPLTKAVSLRAEVHHGENLNAFLAGAGYDAAGDEIESTSGWMQLTAKGGDKTTVNLMYGIESNKKNDLSGGERQENQVGLANVKYKLFKPITVGLEYEYFYTKYKAAPKGTASVIWLSGIFTF